MLADDDGARADGAAGRARAVCGRVSLGGEPVEQALLVGDEGALARVEERARLVLERVGVADPALLHLVLLVVVGGGTLSGLRVVL